MTKTTKEEINGSSLYFIKKIHLIIGIVVLVVTQLGVIYGAYFNSKNHIGNKDIHKTYEDNTEKFVTRLEYEAMVKNMETTLETIADNVKWLRDNQ